MPVAGSLIYKADIDDKDFDSSYEKLKGTVSNGAKIMAGAIAAVSAATVAIGSAAIASYSEYEQLVGGAQLMFADSYDYIAEKAANAYATVQMSQNDYLQQVNGFAVGLKTALGGNAQAAAELADKIVTAEADVIAATGNSQEAVQAAFNGIMKSNFTMLDNLQLGIKPTKEGMQEVIDKVNEWNTANGRATSYQIDNLADCQSALVDYIEMQGIAGYAANEAADTIQGSLSSVKGAWSNLLTGLADDDADFETLIGNFVDSIVNLARNLLPRIDNVLYGISDLVMGFIEQLVPLILEKLPEFIERFTTSISEASVDIVSSIADILPAIVEALVAQLPLILETGITILITLIEGITNALPSLIAMLPEIITKMVNTLIEHLPEIILAGIQLLLALIDGLDQAIAQLIEMLPTIIDTIVNTLTRPDMLNQLINAAIQLMIMMNIGMLRAIPQIIAAIPQIISSIINGFRSMDWGSLGLSILQGILNGFSSAGNIIWNAITSVGNSMISGIKSFFGIASPAKKMKPLGRYNAQGVAEGFKDGTKDVLDSIDNMNNEIYEKMQKSVDLETGDVLGKAYVAANYASNRTINLTTRTGDVNLDGRKVGQFTSPYVTQELRLQGLD